MQALDGLDFQVNQGDIFGFLGPNGSGKSTTIRILTSLVKPDSGSVNLFGLDILKSRKQILPRIGSLIERPSFYEHLSARKNLSLLLKYSAKDSTKQFISETLQLAGLSGRENDKVGKYSEGMKQRLGIAQSLIHQPELLILDEPFNNLDPQGVKDIRELIIKLNRDNGVTVLISSHKLDEIEKLVNRVVLISKGKAVAEGNIHDLVNREKTNLSLEADNPDMVVMLLKNSGIQMDNCLVVGDRIIISCYRNLIPEINKFLVEKGVNVYHLSPDKSLESFFLSFTKST